LIINKKSFRLVHNQMEIVGTIVIISIWKEGKIWFHLSVGLSIKICVIYVYRFYMLYMLIFSQFCLLNSNQMVFTIFRLIWNQMEFRLVLNLSELSKYNLISINSTIFRKDFLVRIILSAFRQRFFLLRCTHEEEYF